MSNWIELPIVGNRHTIVDGRSIQAVEGPGADITARPDNPITVYLRGGTKVEGVIGLSVNAILIWLFTISNGDVRVTYQDNFWKEVGHGAQR